MEACASAGCLHLSSLSSCAICHDAIPAAYAGGPRWVAGSSYFDPSTLGQPMVWQNGVVNYYTDLGDLSPTVTQAQANAMVAAAAALWSGIPTAALQINAAGSLAEDVNGSNFSERSQRPDHAAGRPKHRHRHPPRHHLRRRRIGPRRPRRRGRQRPRFVQRQRRNNPCG